ncbi:MAG: hypothetical protein COA42_17065 [Alteromonadaceae bacterium]|nr:MAG: hypothetical protein COA42_17065 [Alteromonadaceae bacterium]
MLFSAAKSNFPPLVEYAAAHRASYNIMDRYNDTALMMAVENGYLSVAESLVKHGADIHFKNKDGKSAIDYAKESFNPKFLKVEKW